MTDELSLTDRASVAVLLVILLIVGPFLLIGEYVSSGRESAKESLRAFLRTVFVTMPKEIITGRASQ